MADKEQKIASWQLILLGGILLVAFILGVVQVLSGANDDLEDRVPLILNTQSCSASGGNWNSCGSACRGASAETVCIDLCVEYCECTSNNQCPYGSECVDFIDNIGVCTNTF